MSDHIGRRLIVAVLGALLVASSGGASAQQTAPKVPRIGVLWHAGNAEEEKIPLGGAARRVEAEGLRRWARTSSWRIGFRMSSPSPFREPRDRVSAPQRGHTVTVTRQAALAAQRATTTIPIVFLAVPDPVESKLVRSLARPGGNITGYSNRIGRVGSQTYRAPQAGRHRLSARRTYCERALPRWRAPQHRGSSAGCSPSRNYCSGG